MSRYLPLSTVLLAACAGSAGTRDLSTDPSHHRDAVYGDCESAERLDATIERAVTDGIPGLQMTKLDPEALASAASEGRRVGLPVIGREGRLTEVTVTLSPMSIAAEGATAATKSDVASVESLSRLTEPTTWLLTCDSGQGCGYITLLDGERPGDATMFEGMLVDDTLGWFFFESAESLLLNATGARPGVERGCTAIYSADDQYAMQPEGNDPDWPEEPEEPEEKDPPKPDDGNDQVSRTIPIMLDADAAFYDLDPDTWQSRQMTTMVAVQIIYGIIEPASSGVFRVDFKVASQETWVKNGPTTTDKVKLTDEINDPDYYMINHHGKNELSFFFVGKDMKTGIGGRAGSICNAGSDDLGFGTSFAHQRNHAWGQQVPDVDGGYQFSTLFGRTVVAAHEIGHLLGGLHEDGELNACAGGAFPNLCGCTLMLSGASGGLDPDFRKPFFSDANDQNIADCIDDV